MGDEMARVGANMDFALFLLIWAIMMIAMMFPAAAPMIATYNAIYLERKKTRAFIPTWVFVSGYLAIWTISGIGAFVLDGTTENLISNSTWLMDHREVVLGVPLILAGLYQLLPLKNYCLTKCRTPLSFLLSSWREGRTGAFRMGMEHGLYCLGCCWMLFVILVPLGIMNVTAMAILTLLIFAEKSLAIGPRIGKVAAMALIGYGALIIVLPDTLPAIL